MKLKKIVMRKSDGKIFEPSIPDGYSLGDVMRDLITPGHKYYFFEVRELPKKFWQRKKRYERVSGSEVWCPLDPKQFDVIEL